MIVWICDECGCEVKEDKPELCPLCKRWQAEFSEHEVPDPDAAEIASSQRYTEALAILDQYTEGCSPERAEEAFEE